MTQSDQSDREHDALTRIVRVLRSRGIWPEVDAILEEFGLLDLDPMRAPEGCEQPTGERAPLDRAVHWAKEAERSRRSEHTALAQAWATIAVADHLGTANYLANGGYDAPEMEVQL